MATAADYQRNAKDCIDMAEQMAPQMRSTMLEVAMAWLELADAALVREEDIGPGQNASARRKMH